MKEFGIYLGHIKPLSVEAFKTSIKHLNSIAIV